MVNVAEISARDWSPELNNYGEIVESIYDIAQCVRIICTTRKGSVPLRRDFGSDIWKYLDKPLEVARTGIPLAIIEAMQFEPRIEIQAITVELGDEAFQLVVNIEWILRDGSDEVQTTVISSADFQSITSSTTQSLIETADVISPVVVPDFVEIFEQAENT